MSPPQPMTKPTTPGFYWARWTTDKDFIPVEITPTGKVWVIGSSCIIQETPDVWGPSLAPPQPQPTASAPLWCPACSRYVRIEHVQHVDCDHTAPSITLTDVPYISVLDPRTATAPSAAEKFFEVFTARLQKAYDEGETYFHGPQDHEVERAWVAWKEEKTR